jgi:hypothetical protein
MERPITSISIQPATITQATRALAVGDVKHFILMGKEAAINEQGGESLVILTNQSLPREMVLRFMESLLQRPPGSLVDSSIENN